MANVVGGLDTIIGLINKEADEAANKIINEANKKAKAIIDNAKAAADDRINDAQIKADQLYKSICERDEMSTEHEKKQGILSVKQELINKAISDALSDLKNLEKEEYFEFLKKLINKYATNEDGIILMSKNDLETVDFKNFIDESFPKLKLEVSDRVDNGFIVKYGDIEENCILDVLVESNMDNIKENIYSELFS